MQESLFCKRVCFSGRGILKKIKIKNIIKVLINLEHKYLFDSIVFLCLIFMFKIPLFVESQVHKMAVSNKAPKIIFNIVFGSYTFF